MVDRAVRRERVMSLNTEVETAWEICQKRTRVILMPVQLMVNGQIGTHGPYAQKLAMVGHVKGRARAVNRDMVGNFVMARKQKLKRAV